MKPFSKTVRGERLWTQNGMAVLLCLLPLMLSVPIGGALALGEMWTFRQQQNLCRQTAIAFATQISIERNKEALDTIQSLSEKMRTWSAIVEFDWKEEEKLTIHWQTTDGQSFSPRHSCGYDFQTGGLW